MSEKKSEERAQTVIRLTKGQREKAIKSFGGIQKMIDSVLAELPEEENDLYALLPERLRAIYQTCLEEDRAAEVERGGRSLLSHARLTEAVMLESGIIDERRVHRYLLLLQRFGVLRIRFGLFNGVVRIFRSQEERDLVLGRSDARQVCARRAVVAARREPTGPEKRPPDVEAGEAREEPANGSQGMSPQPTAAETARRRGQPCHGA